MNSEYVRLWKDAVIPISRDRFGTRQENKFTTLNLSPVQLQCRQTVLYCQISLLSEN
jgi:hypothetical protein